MPQISIIVPVYNAEKYLRECIDSILRQKYKDFELLLVDDGSSDNSPAISDEYARTDERVKVIHKPNGGVSSARNAGIDASKGKYIVFVDSDDRTGPNYISDMYEAHVQCNADAGKILIMSDYQPFTESGPESRELPEEISVDFAEGNGDVNAFRNLVFQTRVFTPCCKLYSKSIIDEYNLRFDTALKSAEDFDFNFRYIEQTDYIRYIPSVQYDYRVGYKKYTPSNHGVLGDSEIKSVHIMANGIVSLAKRMGVYDEAYDEICIWAAKKHYFNRLPMLFAESEEVGTSERRKLYKALTSDKVYRSLYKRGIILLDESTTRLVGSRFDCFASWLMFYRALEIRNKKSER